MESVQPVLFSSPIYSRKEFFDGPRGTIPETGERSKKENQRNQCRGREAPHRRRRKVPARGCSRRQRMGKGTSSRRRAHGQGRCPFAHSLSSRTSTSRNFSPASMRRFTSATLVSLIFFFASFTSFRNCAAWAIEKLLPGMHWR